MPSSCCNMGCSCETWSFCFLLLLLDINTITLSIFLQSTSKKTFPEDACQTSNAQINVPRQLTVHWNKKEHASHWFSVHIYFGWLQYSLQDYSLVRLAGTQYVHLSCTDGSPPPPAVFNAYKSLSVPTNLLPHQFWHTIFPPRVLTYSYLLPVLTQPYLPLVVITHIDHFKHLPTRPVLL